MDRTGAGTLQRHPGRLERQLALLVPFADIRVADVEQGSIGSAQLDVVEVERQALALLDPRVQQQMGKGEGPGVGGFSAAQCTGAFQDGLQLFGAQRVR
jgi:hypothetical protein